jgi:hypothetical protein
MRRTLLLCLIFALSGCDPSFRETLLGYLLTDGGVTHIPPTGADAGSSPRWDGGPPPGLDAGPGPRWDGGPPPWLDAGPSPQWDGGPPPWLDAGSGSWGDAGVVGDAGFVDDGACLQGVTPCSVGSCVDTPDDSCDAGQFGCPGFCPGSTCIEVNGWWCPAGQQCLNSTVNGCFFPDCSGFCVPN